MSCVKRLNRVAAAEQIRSLIDLPDGEEIILGCCDSTPAILSARRYGDNYVEFTHFNADGKKYLYRLPFNWRTDNAYNLVCRVLAIVAIQSSCEDVYDSAGTPAICRIDSR